MVTPTQAVERVKMTSHRDNAVNKFSTVVIFPCNFHCTALLAK